MKNQRNTQLAPRKKKVTFIWVQIFSLVSTKLEVSEEQNALTVASLFQCVMSLNLWSEAELPLSLFAARAGATNKDCVCVSHTHSYVWCVSDVTSTTGGVETVCVLILDFRTSRWAGKNYCDLNRWYNAQWYRWYSLCRDASLCKDRSEVLWLFWFTHL